MTLRPGAKPRRELTAETARRLLRYEPTTGELYWRESRGRVRAGDRAGHPARLRNATYRLIRVDKIRYLAHRVVWLMAHGVWPEHNIDHVDGDGLNNRLDNLRDVDNAVNVRNSRLWAHNSSGVNGVYRLRASGKWAACIKVDQRDIWLGSYVDREDAIAARLAANKRYGFHDKHGERRA